MNLLCETLPSTVMVGGSRFEIDTTLSTGVRIMLLMEDDNVSNDVRPLLALRMFYPKLPSDIAEAYRKMLWFYNCGKTPEAGTSDSAQPVAYNFAHDGNLIFAAFHSQYNLNLRTANLHWWEFLALFEALTEENLIVKIMQWRTADTSKLKGEQRSFVQKMQRLYRLPHSKKQSAEDKEIAEILLHGGDLAARAKLR